MANDGAEGRERWVCWRGLGLAQPGWGGDPIIDLIDVEDGRKGRRFLASLLRSLEKSLLEAGLAFSAARPENGARRLRERWRTSDLASSLSSNRDLPLTMR